MNICMIGTGYVGLVSAVCFSEFGWTVNCVDKDASKIERLRAGEIPIYEPGLEELLARNAEKGRIHFFADLKEPVSQADLIFLAVGTPMRRGDGFADLSYVHAAVEELVPYLSGFTVITTKSTVPVGTSREIERRIREMRPDADIAVCSNPEFLREGSAIQDFTHPDRVLVGVDDERARMVMERVYEPLRLRNAPILFASRRHLHSDTLQDVHRWSSRTVHSIISFTLSKGCIFLGGWVKWRRFSFPPLTKGGLGGLRGKP